MPNFRFSIFLTFLSITLCPLYSKKKFIPQMKDDIETFNLIYNIGVYVQNCLRYDHYGKQEWQNGSRYYVYSFTKMAITRVSQNLFNFGLFSKICDISKQKLCFGVNPKSRKFFGINNFKFEFLEPKYLWQSSSPKNVLYARIFTNLKNLLLKMLVEIRFFLQNQKIWYLTQM